MTDSKKSKWFPEIMYEESEDGESSKIPFVLVPETEKMPSLLYVFESRLNCYATFAQILEFTSFPHVHILLLSMMTMGTKHNYLFRLQ